MRIMILVKNELIYADGWMLAGDTLTVAFAEHWDNGGYNPHKEYELRLQGVSNGDKIYGDGKGIAAKFVADEPYVGSGYERPQFLSIGNPYLPAKEVELVIPPDDSEGKRPLGYVDFYDILTTYLTSQKPYSFIYEFPESEREKISNVISCYNRYTHLAYQLTTNFQYSPNFSWPDAYIAPLYGVLHRCHKNTLYNTISSIKNIVKFNDVVIGRVKEILKEIHFVTGDLDVVCVDKKRVLEFGGLLALSNFLKGYDIDAEFLNSFVLSVGSVKIYNIPIQVRNKEKELVESRSKFEYVINYNTQIIVLTDLSDVLQQLRQWGY